MATKFKKRCKILAELWLNFRDDENFEDFITYNDLGLPLAYAIANGYVERTEKAQTFIDEAFELLLAGLGYEEDYGFKDLDELLDTEAGGTGGD
jgi:hypothetical protein